MSNIKRELPKIYMCLLQQQGVLPLRQRWYNTGSRFFGGLLMLPEN